MSATPSPTQLFLADALSTEPSSAEVPAELENGGFTSKQRSSDKTSWLTFAYFLTAVGIGVVATLAWKVHADAAKEALAPAAALKSISVDLDAVRQNVNRIANDMAITQDKMTRSVDQLAARVATGREEITLEITALQTAEQKILDKISMTAPVATPKPVLRPLRASTALTPAKTP